VKHGRAEANDKNSEVGKAYTTVISSTAADDHAVKRNSGYRQAAQAVPHFGDISIVHVVALAPVHVAADEATLRPEICFLWNGPPEGKRKILEGEKQKKRGNPQIPDIAFHGLMVKRVGSDEFCDVERVVHVVRCDNDRAVAVASQPFQTAGFPGMQGVLRRRAALSARLLSLAAATLASIDAFENPVAKKDQVGDVLVKKAERLLKLSRTFQLPTYVSFNTAWRF
jgi:hypothetical protein